MSEKLLDTVSAKVTPDLHRQALILAGLDGQTVSSLINLLLTEYVAGKRSLHLQLSRAFGEVDGLQDLPHQ